MGSKSKTRNREWKTTPINFLKAWFSRSGCVNIPYIFTKHKTCSSVIFNYCKHIGGVKRGGTFTVGSGRHWASLRHWAQQCIDCGVVQTRPYLVHTHWMPFLLHRSELNGKQNFRESLKIGMTVWKSVKRIPLTDRKISSCWIAKKSRLTVIRINQYFSTRVRGYISVRGTFWMSAQALGTNKFAIMPSSNNNFINFIQQTFLFVQRINVPYQREKFQHSTVLHDIYTFECQVVM